MLTDRSLVDFGVIEDKLNVSHLEKDTQDRVREIEKNRKDGFARKGKIVGNFTRFLYDLPIQLDQPILAVRRHFDSEVIKEVTHAFQELVDEGVICEAGDCIKLVSNLLPVSKPTAEYALSSKIDKKNFKSQRKGA